ncbi:hypothetical protein PFISCL1PPCAC_26867 [Pristionchus fissidentatus]|uniref:Uncharacterized protein n=1 Tax=Pristionchus fissidentatus TaxID=1538716 RepID=A0AAV5WVL9_9BILA|nr:hypothetical protein PFISCL1PPCAC_26867 [Pristionchus fissidentatus]
MALIYANAVNKRMGMHGHRRKKSEISYRACSPCPYGNHHKYSMEEQRPRKKSSTVESGIMSDHSSTVHSSHSTSPVRGESKRHVTRSKTTSACCDLSRAGDMGRKRSTPVFGNSHTCSKEREEMRERLTKKHLEQRGEMRSAVNVPIASSLDEEDEESANHCYDDNKEGSSMERKGSVFSRMKRKFSNWKM